MKKKVVLLIVTLFLIIVPNVIFAFDSAISKPNPTIDGDVGEMVRTFLGAIKWIGYAIAIGMLIYIGIKYMMASANEKADMKRSSINFVIGAIVVAASVTIFDWCVTFFSDADSGTNTNGTGAGVSDSTGNFTGGGSNTGATGGTTVIGGPNGLENLFDNGFNMRE